MSNGEPAVVETTVGKATARIDWRKLAVPSLFIMVLPTISALVLDKWLGTFPYITIVAIIICFPTATIWVVRLALQEMDRVIAEVTPDPMPEAAAEEVLTKGELSTPSEVGISDIGVELNSSP